MAVTPREDAGGQGTPQDRSRVTNPNLQSITPAIRESVMGGQARFAASERGADSRYLELAKEPEKNRGILQRMVDEAAKKAGYNVSAFHGTDKEPFSVFEGDRGIGPAGIFFSRVESEAIGYATLRGKNGRVISAKLKVENPISEERYLATTKELHGRPSFTKSEELMELRKHGDGMF